jgi:hypothetical protein
MRYLIIILALFLGSPVSAKVVIRPTLSKKIYQDTSPYMIVPSGLVGYWTLNGNNVGAVTVSDISGTGNNGSIITPSTTATSSLFTSGKLGQAWGGNGGLTGANATYVSVPRNSTLNLSTAVSLCAWVYPRTGTNNGILHKGTIASGQPDYGLDMSTTNRILFRLNGAGSDVFTTNNAVPFNTWTHICGTYDKVSQIIYVNGVSNNSVAFSTNITDTASSAFYIGVYFSTSFTFNGIIDDVRIYNRAITGTEVAQLAKAGQYKIRTTLP